MDKLHPNAKNLTGQRFGRLITIFPTKGRIKRSIVWCCLCSCGEKCFIDSDSLHSGRIRSCGCLQKELLIKRNTKHGMHGTPTYRSWRSMLSRCENPSFREYKYWGGRGITVCDEWHKFENFYEDMGLRPKGTSLDRWPNNEGNYKSTNCRWATTKEQRSNQRDRRDQRWFFAYNENTGEWDEDNNQHKLAKRWNLSNANISACLHGKQKTHKGWIFEYLFLHKGK